MSQLQLRVSRYTVQLRTAIASDFPSQGRIMRLSGGKDLGPQKSRRFCHLRYNTWCAQFMRECFTDFLFMTKRLSFRRGKVKGGKKHINVFNINFLAPTQNPKFEPPEKSRCASLPGKKTRKRDPHKLCRGDFGGQKRRPRWAIFGHNKSSLLSFSCP